jgi:hypothetical protein
MFEINDLKRDIDGQPAGHSPTSLFLVGLVERGSGPTHFKTKRPQALVVRCGLVLSGYVKSINASRRTTTWSIGTIAGKLGDESMYISMSNH